LNSFQLAAKTIYYLPGYGGQLATGLGEELTRRSFDVTGRETTGEFRKLWFPDQLDLIAQDLKVDLVKKMDNAYF
jgi:hypothetical protein